MTDDSLDFRTRRRLFLRSIGALGLAAAAAGTATATHESSGSVGEYHTALRNDLTASSRQQRELPPGEYVYATTEAEALDAFTLVGEGGTETKINVDTDAVPISVGERLDVPAAAEDPSAYAYRGDITNHSFESGDLLLGVAWVRSDTEAAEAKASFRYRYTDAAGETRYTDSFVQRGAHIEPTGDWMRYYFPIEVGEVPGSDAVPALEFWTGYAQQQIEFGGVALFDYSGPTPEGEPEATLDKMPPYHYEGRALDADWRDEARERIDEIRRADLEVEVRTPGGQPMEGASVEVEMVEHAFDFGSAVSATHITGDGEDDRIYRETFLKNFNKATPENALKYPAWENVWDGFDDQSTMRALGWLNERDVPVRGHYLLWEQFDPSSGGGMNVDPSLPADEILQRVSRKIRTHANRFEEEVTEWDMHNHPVWQPNFREMDGLGWDAVRRWWAVANDATDDELYTNEMGVVGGAWQRQAYHDYITHLVENGYPLDGIGFMGHHQKRYNQLLDVQNIIDGFELFSEFGVPLLVTEFDIQIFDRRNAQGVELQKDYLRDFLTVAFSQEAAAGVVSWGFWAKDHWRPTGAYYDDDWTLRPHGEMYRELVFDRWWTHETGETDGDGTYGLRGFKGIYEVTAEKGALSGETTVTLDDDTGTVTVELCPPPKDCSTEGGESDGPAEGRANAD